jgi:hypothetical protein
MSGAFSSSFPWSPAGPATLGMLQLGRAGNYFQTYLYESLPVTNTTWAVTSPTLPMWKAGGTLVSVNAQMAAWFPVGPGTVSGTVVQARYSRANPPNPAIPFSWNFIVPPTITAFTFPKLPSEYAYLTPHTDDTGSGTVQLVYVPSAPNYDAFRALPEKNLVCPMCGVAAGDLHRVAIN